MNRPVLLVEDSDNDIFLMERCWKKEGIVNPLLTVGDGRQAMHYLDGRAKYADREQYPLPGLLLLDLKLPYVMGLEVLKWIREQPKLKALPVLVLTTSAQQSDIDRAYQIGASAFLVKPSGMNELSRLVRLIRDFWLEVNHSPRLGPELD